MDDRNYDEIVSEQNEKLRIQRNYYRRLHLDDLYPQKRLPFYPV